MTRTGVTAKGKVMIDNRKMMGKLEEIVQKTAEDPGQVFEDLLTYIITGFCPNEKGVVWRHDGEDEVNRLFWEMTQTCMKIYADGINKYGWFDGLGTFYEECVNSDGKRRMHEQYFTPNCLCSLACRLVDDSDAGKRVVYDPTCGSGRMMLPEIPRHPYSYFVGTDIDGLTSKICVCNLLMHGVRGLVICHDTLGRTPPRFAYAVNPEIFDSVSPYHGIPHIIRKDESNRVGHVFDKLYAKITGKEEVVCHG